MVNHSIKVFARLKRENRRKATFGVYEILKKKSDFDDIVFYSNFLQQGGTPSTFRFHKVFDQQCNQEDIFDVVAKPVVNSVIQGFNGTIFAYGQTGSGKTYTITGSPKNYNDRGIIPRSIQYIFAENEKISIKPTIYISYMEIYNEIGYDLLSPRQHNTARSLEELPRIALLEDGKGEAHFRNLSVLPVTTEQEAMRLLFLGDTNRTIAETPLNEYSSRSHCIFTIYINYRNEPSNVFRFSKLHLVDLAGSERVYKSQTTGTALNEAKYINLSLHFLQQVILALSESKRPHIPYRNSMMTYILKDSLSGNCLTVMLAALAVSKNNIQESISTCRFAQRVSLITTDPIINEISDPQQEIMFLRTRIQELQCQISMLTGLSTSKSLNEKQVEKCKNEIEKYIQSGSNSELVIDHDLKQINYCFNLMKEKIITQEKRSNEQKLSFDDIQRELKNLREAVNKKDEEIKSLRKIIDQIPEHPVNLHGKCGDNVDTSQFGKDSTSLINSEIIYDFNKYPTIVDITSSYDFSQEEQFLFEKFINLPENSKNLDYFTQNLEKKLEMAKIYAEAIEQCQKNIVYIRQELDDHRNYAKKNVLIQEVEEQQNIYRKSLIDLKRIKDETGHLQGGLQQAEMMIIQKFRQWLNQQKSKSNIQAKPNSCNAHNFGKVDNSSTLKWKDKIAKFSFDESVSCDCQLNQGITELSCNSCSKRCRDSQEFLTNYRERNFQCDEKCMEEAYFESKNQCMKNNYFCKKDFPKNYHSFHSNKPLCKYQNKHGNFHSHPKHECFLESQNLIDSQVDSVTNCQECYLNYTENFHDRRVLNNCLEFDKTIEKEFNCYCKLRQREEIFANCCEDINNCDENMNKCNGNIMNMTKIAPSLSENDFSSNIGNLQCLPTVATNHRNTNKYIPVNKSVLSSQEELEYQTRVYNGNNSVSYNSDKDTAVRDEEECYCNSFKSKGKIKTTDNINRICKNYMQTTCEKLITSNNDKEVCPNLLDEAKTVSNNLLKEPSKDDSKNINNYSEDNCQASLRSHQGTGKEEISNVMQALQPKEINKKCINVGNLHRETDSLEFKIFMKTVPLTGDVEIDEEIFNFYRQKFC